MSDCKILNTEIDAFTKRLEKTAYQKSIPYKGVFELTARCNFNCNMCYIHLNEKQIRDKGRELTNEEWLEIARQARDAGMLYLTLTGGEVFTRPNFKELYESLSQMGFLIQILSNGYLVDDKVIEWLKECPPYELRFTLYGASNKTYEEVCGVKDGFDKVCHAINLVSETKIPFYMVGTIVKENEADLRDMYAFARKRNIPFKHTIAVVNPVRGATSAVSNHRINAIDLTNEEIHNIKKVDRFYPKVDNFLDLCGSYRKGFWITWDGKMQLCSFMEYPAIDIKAYPFEEVWKQLLSELVKLDTPDECKSCKYEGFCQRCPGVLAAECGAPDKVKRSFCDKARVIYNIYCMEEKKFETNK